MKWPKLSLSNLVNVVLIGIFLFIIIQRLPTLIHHFQMEGSVAPSLSLKTLEGKNYDLLKDDQRRALVFWATWCGPCDVELNRIQKMIDAGELDPDQVIAISSYEEENLLREVVAQRAYTFTVGVDQQGDAAKRFNVSGTPTVVLKERDGTIAWMTNGISPSLELRLSRFLDER